MRKFVIAATALLVAAPAVAQNAQPTRFEHEGVHYEYVVTQRADGSRLIQGRNLSEQRKFSLVERDGLVTGSVGSSDVSYRVPAVKKASAETKGAGF